MPLPSFSGRPSLTAHGGLQAECDWIMPYHAVIEGIMLRAVLIANPLQHHHVLAQLLVPCLCLPQVLCPAGGCHYGIFATKRL